VVDQGSVAGRPLIADDTGYLVFLYPYFDVSNGVCSVELRISWLDLVHCRRECTGHVMEAIYMARSSASAHLWLACHEKFTCDVGQVRYVILKFNSDIIVTIIVIPHGQRLKRQYSN